MSYDDSKTPAIKGNFEYRQGVEHIFKQQNIGKYSSKIANICNYIYGNTIDQNIDSENKDKDKDKKKVSDGIIIIYSSYIDGGLIPMALALEEMGFTRFGKNATSLFKNAPTPIVDVKTMTPASSTNKHTFKPARYAMITGDKRLSPNNDSDIKIITDTNYSNVNGEEVKVVLLSQAGSEGLDFKEIRQIHILDPWYNVSRIEQIIGRGVRNFSHKDLEFAYRNVQIFLYGTMLSNTKEEAADLYIYRISEIKAVKIGKVTRILKQISVDCHINHDQTKLTTKNFIKGLGEKAQVEQILSNHEKIEEFLVGDINNSATCDYQTCSFDCLPDATSVDIIDDKFNLNTYNETFMLVNSEKIIQRIKRMFKDKQDGKFFYKKKTLMYLIKQEHNYPTDQIYASLTQMITDNAEYIIDKYGRIGHLINIGEYYLFQPSELNYPNISIFDRSRPLDYKHNMIKFEIKTDIVKPVIDKRNVNMVVLEEGNKILNGINVLDKMFGNYILALKKDKVSKGTNNWYEYCGTIMRKMVDDTIISGTDKNERYNILKVFLIKHIVDELMMMERIDLMNYLHEFVEIENSIPDLILKNILDLFETLKVFKELEHTKIIKDMFADFTIEVRRYLYSKIIQANKGRLKGIVVFDGPSSLFNDGNNEDGNLNIYILKGKLWVPAEAEDKRDFEPIIKRKYGLTTVEKTYLNKYVGFIGFENNKKYMTFKLKDTSEDKNTAYRCDQSGKDNIIDMLNNIESNKLNINRFIKKVKKGSKMTEEEYKEINKHKTKDGAFELCIREEFTLRSFQYDEDKKDIKDRDKIWFLETEKAIYNEFEKREKIVK